MEPFVPTTEEMQSIGKAMQDPKFRELLAEYAKEISDPANKQKYEEEIRQMEAEQGNDVKFVNPEPGFVVKTVLQSNGKKVFINICESAAVEEPIRRTVKRNGQTGTNWSVPHSLTSHREDTDKEGRPCIVYDAVFHPKALRLAKTDKRIKDMLIKTAFDGIHQRFPQHKLDESIKKFPKIKFKGNAHRSMIRNKKGNSADTQNAESKENAIKKLASEFSQLQADAQKKTQTNIDGPSEKKPAGKKVQIIEHEDEKQEVDIITPKYTIVERGEFDLMGYRNAPDSVPAFADRPKELSVTIELPLCQSASGVDLDVNKDCLSMECKERGPYKLSVSLPYPVNEDAGAATFDKSSRSLKIVLPVLPPPPIASDCPVPNLETDHEEGDPEADEAIPDTDQEDANPETDHEEADPVEVDEAHNETQVTTSQDKEPEDVPFSFHQNPESVTVIIDVSHIDPKSLHLTFGEHSFGPLNVHSCQVTFEATIDSFQSINCITFKFDALIKKETVFTNVSQKNAVLVFEKVEPVNWHRIQAGSSVSALSEFRFPTLQTESTSETPDAWTEIYSEKVSDQRFTERTESGFRIVSKEPPQTTTKTSDGRDNDFIPSGSFCGSKPGFIFKQDTLGLGYYRDEHLLQSTTFPGLKHAFRDTEKSEEVNDTEDGGPNTLENKNVPPKGESEVATEVVPTHNDAHDVSEAPSKQDILPLKNNLLDDLE
eukprot:m.172497 g.172497  ORF g.172497 m.172497 type:complete len:713 (+) comp15370_c0_seq6:134-2272(+)